MRRLLRPRCVAGLLVAAGVTWLASAALVVDALTAPSHRDTGAVDDVAWAIARDLEVQATDGARVPASSFDVEEPRGVVVLLHPNDGTRRSMTAAAEAWAALGFSSIAITLRAHGGAEGERNDFGWTSRLDVLAALRWACERTAGPVYVHGVSLGASAACLAGPELEAAVRARVAGFVLESPFVDLRTAVRCRTASALPPGLDRVAALGLAAVAPLFIGDVDRIAPLAAAAALPGRVLVLSGRHDERAPARETRRFADVLGDRATLIERDAGHIAWHSARYRDALGEDLREWVLAGHAPR